MSPVIRCLLLIIGLWVWSGPSIAGLVIVGAEEAAQKKQAMTEALRAEFPDLFTPFDVGAATTDCKPGDTPRTFAIVIGVSDPGPGVLIELPGVANDVALLSETLLSHGLDKTRTRVLLDEQATRENLQNTLDSVLNELGCNDSVLLSYSGHAANDDAFRYVAQQKEIVSSSETTATVSDALNLDSVTPALFLQPYPGGKISTLTAPDLSGILLRLRNTGADVTVILDTMFADEFRLQERQARHDPNAPWSSTINGASVVETADLEGLLPGAGNLTTLYAVSEGGQAQEFPLPKDAPDAKPYGLFSYKLASALHSNGAITPRTLAQTMPAFQVDSFATQSHLFQSTDPDIPIIAEKRKAQTESTIRILSPKQTRGAMDMPEPQVNILGRVEWPEQPLIVVVNKQEATLLPNGEFSHTLRLDPGVTRVEVLALTADSRQHRHAFDVRYKGEEQALLGDGTRYAVLIANQSYGGDTGMAPLATPFADIDALEQVLTQRYGFTTQARTADGQDLSLVLRDASRRDIEILLHRIARIAGIDDTVLVYYAGHGDYERRTGNAYWVPADAVDGIHGTYLSSDAVSDALKRIDSNNLLLIADSCFSGGFRGEPGAEETTEEDRLKRLSRMVGKRSRELISSGNIEVVQDQGGDGHSVFARALLNGLQNMEPKAFTASELYGRIHADVFSTAEQEPQNIKLYAAGHEGGGFVFVQAQ